MWFKKAFSQRKATSEVTTKGKRATEIIKQRYNFSANEFDNLFLGPDKQSLEINFLHFQSTVLL